MYFLDSTHVLLALACVLQILEIVLGHGRLIEPPSRASMWRYNFSTPQNYDDTELFCGGFTRQWKKNDGDCGVCGDPWDEPVRQHEAGGRFATGTIVRQYRPGDIIDVTIELTANHKGWFEFRLCPNNNPQKRVTHGCLNRYLLKEVKTGLTRYAVTKTKASWPQYTSDMYYIKLQLPSCLHCTQCVLQWKYNAGNSWNTDRVTGESCIGCGPQEQFYGCSDIAIERDPNTGYKECDPAQISDDPRSGCISVTVSLVCLCLGLAAHRLIFHYY